MPRSTIVLAACETLRRPPPAQVFALSLGGAFLAAGAGDVIGTLDDIADDDAYELFGAVHRALTAGVSADDAVRLSLTERRPLPGVRITVPNAADPDVTYDPTFFTCIPRIVTFAPNLPPLSRDVIGGRNPELASAYFDAAGRFFGRVDQNGASFALLEVVTDGDPLLRIENFRGGRIENLPLQDGAHIQIENLGPGAGGDRDHDFLLNFKIAQSIPTDAGWPTSPALCPPIFEAVRAPDRGPGLFEFELPVIVPIARDGSW